MKIIVAIDGSPYSNMVVSTLKALKLSPINEVITLNIIPEYTFLGGLNIQHLINKHIKTPTLEAQKNAALELLQKPTLMLQEAGINVTTSVTYGKPAEQIMKFSHDNKADLIMIGAKGTHKSSKFQLGSVTQKVMRHADTSVLLVKETTKKIRSVFIATDGSEYSDDVANFLIDLPIPKQTGVVLGTGLESHIASLVKMPTLDIATNKKIIKELRQAEEKQAYDLITEMKNKFHVKGYHTESMILRGDPAEEILKYSQTIYPDLIAVGAKGLGGIENFQLGSVARRVARFSRYSVLIVRKRRL